MFNYFRFSRHTRKLGSGHAYSSSSRFSWRNLSWRVRILAILVFSFMLAILRMLYLDTLVPNFDHYITGRDIEASFRSTVLPDPHIPHFLFRATNGRVSDSVAVAAADVDVDVDDDNSNTIPNIIHIVPPPNFGFMEYLTLASAITVQNPSRIYMHVNPNRLPTGWWWEATQRHFATAMYPPPPKNETSRPRVAFETILTQEITHIFNQPITNPSHKADILRLDALAQYGGIYLDTDVLVLQPFTALLAEDTVLAVESRQSSRGERVFVEGLCNAVMLSKPNAAFIRAWKEEYRTFDSRQWNRHSVLLPWEMAKRWPSYPLPPGVDARRGGKGVTVLDHRAFFWPIYNEAALRAVHDTLPPARQTGTSDGLINHNNHEQDSPSTTANTTIPTPAPTPDILTLGNGYAYHMWRSFYLKKYGQGHHARAEKDAAAKAARAAAGEGGGGGGGEGEDMLMSPEDVLGRDSAFNLAARRFLLPELMREWRGRGGG